MQRMLILGVALLATLAAGTARAQVATTDLVPAAPVFIHPNGIGANGANITPDNPAALAWGKPSRVAAGVIKGTIKLPGLPNADYSGNFLGARAVGETFGVAIEQQKIDDDSIGNKGTLDKSNDGQLSINFGKRFAIGFGIGKTSQSANATEMSRTELGGSLRLGEVWYVGVAGYQDKLTQTGTTEVKRNATLVGIALRTEGTVTWYAAAEQIKLNDFPFTGGPGSGIKDKRLSVQMQAGWLLVGLSSTKVAVISSGTGTPPDVKHTVVDLGIVPMSGLAVSARVQSTKIDDPTGTPPKADIDTTSLALTWLF